MNKKLLTNEELVAEFRHDWFSNLRDRCYGIMSDPKYRKYILNNVKNNQRHYFKPVKLEENGNTYILQIDTKGRSDYKKNGLLFIIYRLYTRKEGTYAMMQYYSRNRLDEDRYCIFPPHLFERYRERVLKDKNLPEEGNSYTSAETFFTMVSMSDQCANMSAHMAIWVRLRTKLCSG